MPFYRPMVWRQKEPEQLPILPRLLPEAYWAVGLLTAGGLLFAIAAANALGRYMKYDQAGGQPTREAAMRIVFGDPILLLLAVLLFLIGVAVLVVCRRVREPN